MNAVIAFGDAGWTDLAAVTPALLEVEDRPTQDVEEHHRSSFVEAGRAEMVWSGVF